MKFLLLGLFLIHSLFKPVFTQEQENVMLQQSSQTFTQQPTLTVQKIQPDTQQMTISEIQSMLEKLSVEISSVSQTTILLARYYIALSKKLDEMIRRYDELISLIISSEPATESNEQKTQLSSNQQVQQPSTSPQYVKVKVKDRGQEMEFAVDPTYVDMNLELKRMMTQEKEQIPTQPTTVPEQQKQQYSSKQQKQISESDREELMKYIETSIKSLEKRQDITQEIPKDVLDDLFTAQKLFYKKRYIEALKAVQRSLSKQETAIGYSIEGSLYFVLGDIDAAVSSWNRALELDPNMDDVREALYRYARTRLRR